MENHGKSPFLMGKSTISTGPCSIAMFVRYLRLGRWDLDPDPGEHQNSWEMDAHSPKHGINGNFRNREELEVPTIFLGLCFRPMFQAYVREYPHTITIDGSMFHPQPIFCSGW